MKALKYKYFVCLFCFTRRDQIVCIGRCLNGIEMEEFSLMLQTKDSLMLKLMRNKVLYDLPVAPARLPCIYCIQYFQRFKLYLNIYPLLFLTIASPYPCLLVQ